MTITRVLPCRECGRLVNHTVNPASGWAYPDAHINNSRVCARPTRLRPEER